MRLYDYAKSSAAYRVRIALNLKGVDADLTDVDLRTGAQGEAAYGAVSPSGLVPTLTHGELTLGQSLAICRYLDRLHPEPRLFPEDPVAEARVNEMALTVACDVHPLNNLRVLNYLRGPLGQDEPDVMAWYAHWIEAGFTALEQLVGRHGSDTHCFGETVSMADLCLVPQMFNARRFDVPLDAFPRLLAIDAALRARPAFEAAAPA